MADYWKSQPRKFCQYCKCWIADNKPSIEFHERGKNHKENVAAKISEIKKKSVDKAKQEKKMCKQFAAMEEAAMKAYEEDLKRMEKESQGFGRLAPQAPPPKSSTPPPQSSTPPPQHSAPPPQPSAPPPRSKKQKVKLEEKESNVWLEGFSDEGHVYYYNTQTGESRWDKPEGFQGSSQSQNVQSSWFGVWTEAVSPDGFLYYYNTQTGESSWDKPADFPLVEEPPAPGTTSAAEGTLGDPDHPDQEVTISFRKRKADDDDPACRDEEETGEGTGAEPEKTEEEEEKEEEKTEEDKKVEKEEKEKAEEEEKTVVKIQVKRSRKVNPYGAWEKIKEEKDPYANVDLQLPQFEEFPPSVPNDFPPEPKPKFKERIITSLGDGGGGATTFRRNKKNRNLRQRDESD